jgi:S-(hydroxymethyl)glutathione dehydrogenase/alcohol dehydrogenase
MKVEAAVLWERHSPWKVEEIDLGEPHAREVLVQIKASGICHSDDHAVTGDFQTHLPQIGGHEGAGVVVSVGDNVTRVKVGDHVILSAIPSCGTCRWCSAGRANLCDAGASSMTVEAPDGTVRRHHGDVPVSALCQLGTFSPYVTVSEFQTVPIDRDVPFEVAALIGCGVTTGVQASTKVADVVTGDVVVVQGVGGVGVSAVQGARIAGATTIVAVDPVPAKRDWALGFGATHTAATMEEATELVSELTRGVMADKAILCVGVAHGSHIGPLLDIVSKGGRVVVSSVAPMSEQGMSGSVFQLGMMNKELRGHVYGQANPIADFPRTIALYRSGALKLDEMITRRLPLHDVNEGFAAMHAGTVIRSVITFD